MARKEKQYHFIYKTTNLLNGKYYYGMHSTDDLNDGYYGSGKRLRRSLNKYGKENHNVEQLEFLPDRKSLISREKEIVNLNEIAKNDCMNLMIGGKGGMIIELYNNGHYSRIAKIVGDLHAFRLKTDVEYRKNFIKRFSDMVKNNHKLGKYNYGTFTNKKHTEETKKLMSIKASKRIGDKNSQYGTCWITKNGKNKTIKLIQLNEYLILGWIRGRKM
jgi:hypothetical protein